MAQKTKREMEMQKRISELEENVQATTEDSVHKRDASVIDEEKTEVTLPQHEGYSDVATQTKEDLGPLVSLPVSDIVCLSIGGLVVLVVLVSLPVSDIVYLSIAQRQCVVCVRVCVCVFPQLFLCIRWKYRVSIEMCKASLTKLLHWN